MEKLFNVIFSKKVITILIAVFEIALIVVSIMLISDYVQYIWGLSVIVAFIIVIYEINRESSPAFKITWVVLVLLIPVFGSLLYLFLHTNTVNARISRRLRRNIEASQYLLHNSSGAEEYFIKYAGSRRGIMRYLYAYCGFPAYCASDIEYYSLGDDMFPAMMEEMEKSEKFIFLEYFIINEDSRMWREMLSLLRRKVADGVEVRVMYDGMGSMTTVPQDYDDAINAMGIKCRVFSPIVPFLSTHQNNRDHRKMLIIDGKTVFTGGVNLADEYINERERFGHWKDTGIKLTGGAVNSFTVMFLQMWNVLRDGNEPVDKYSEYLTPLAETAGTNGIVVPFSDSPLDRDRVAEQTLIDVLNTADSYVHIMTPYLVLDSTLNDALKYAARRGVDVVILMPHIPDKPYAFTLARTYYEELMFAGVKIYEYTPGFVHAKMTIADGKTAVTGTMNYDFRSLYLHYECGVYIADNTVIADMEADFQNTLTRSQLITYRDLEDIPLHTRIEGNVLRLLAPLM